MLLVPIFVSPMVLCFGYVVAMGPVGFYSLWAKELLGFSLPLIGSDLLAGVTSRIDLMLIGGIAFAIFAAFIGRAVLSA